MITTTTKQEETFSDRFNFLLDKAGFPPIGTGRARALAMRFDVSKSGAQNWIGRNFPPKRDTLQTIVNELLADFEEHYDPEKVIAWLEHGNVVNNPFKRTQAPQHPNLVANHVLLSRIYVTVHTIAKTKGLDIYSLDDDVMDHIYDSVIQKAIENDQNEPDKFLINSLLELCSKKL